MLFNDEFVSLSISQNTDDKLVIIRNTWAGKRLETKTQWRWWGCGGFVALATLQLTLATNLSCIFVAGFCIFVAAL